MKTKAATLKTTSKDLIAQVKRDFLLTQDPKTPHIRVGELSEWKGKTLMGRIYAFLNKCLNVFDGSDFFILVKRMAVPTDRLRFRLILKQAIALPTPTYGWSYWHYKRDKQKLELICDIPNKKACKWAFKHRYAVSLQKPVAMHTILSFYDGSLRRQFDEINEQVRKKEGMLLWLKKQ